MHPAVRKQIQKDPAFSQGYTLERRPVSSMKRHGRAMVKVTKTVVVAVSKKVVELPADVHGTEVVATSLAQKSILVAG